MDYLIPDFFLKPLNNPIQTPNTIKSINCTLYKKTKSNS